MHGRCTVRGGPLSESGRLFKAEARPKHHIWTSARTLCFRFRRSLPLTHTSSNMPTAIDLRHNSPAIPVRLEAERALPACPRD